MAAPDMQLAGLQNGFFPALLQSLLSEICSRVVQAFAQRFNLLEDSSSSNMISCANHSAETRLGDVSIKLIEECMAKRVASDFDEENDSLEKCRVRIYNKVAAPDRADRAPRQEFSDWLLVAKNKDDEDEDDDEEEDDEDDDDDEEGDEEEGDDEEGGDAEGEGDGDEDEEDDAEDDDEEEEEEDDDEDEDEEDESPPKKLRK